MTTPLKYEDLALKVAELERTEAALREELYQAKKARDAEMLNGVRTQQRLTVAEQRVSELKKLLCAVINESPTGFAALKVDLANRVNDALKPAAEVEGS